MLSQWWYTTVSTVDDIHGVAVMICNSLRNWLYTMLRIDFNKNMCYNFVEKEVILFLRTICLFIQSNSQLISHCCVKALKHQATLFSKFKKVQAVFTQIFAKQIMVKVRQICFPNLKLHWRNVAKQKVGYNFCSTQKLLMKIHIKITEISVVALDEC